MMVSTRSPADVAKSFLKLMEALDYHSAIRIVADGCEYTNPPPIGTVRGPGGIRAVLEPFFAPTLENEFRICVKARPALSSCSNGSIGID